MLFGIHNVTMRLTTKLLIFTLLFGSSVLAQQNRPAYQVLNLTEDESVETKINEAAGQGYAVARFLVDPKLQYVVVLRRISESKSPRTYRIFSRTVADGSTFRPPSTLDQPLSDIGRGFRIVPRSAAFRKQQLLLLLESDNRQWDYRITHGKKSKDIDKELADYGKEGFRPIEYFPDRPFREVLLERQVGAQAVPLNLRTAGTNQPDELKKRLLEMSMEGFRALVVSDELDVVLTGGNAALPDANVFLSGDASKFEQTLRSASKQKIRLLVPVGSNYDRRGIMRGMVHTVGAVFETSENSYDYRLVNVGNNLGEFSRTLNRLQGDGWELRDLFPHWDPSDRARMLAILERKVSER
jgi:hypothetical protein